MTTFTDRSGQNYTPPNSDGKTVSDGTSLVIHTANGPVSGTMRGGTAQTDKEKS